MAQPMRNAGTRTASLSFLRSAAVTAGSLILWRLLAALPVPIANSDLVAAEFQRTTVHGPLALIAGPPIEGLSVVAMGLEPFLDAFVIFWFLGVVSSEIREARSDEKKLWRYLAWLTVALASFRAFGLTVSILKGHAGAVTSSAGLATILVLIGGTMGLFAMGRMIDRFGLPRGYGVWLLFGVGSLLEGVHSIARFVDKDVNDPTLPMVIGLYGLISIVLAASAILAFDGVRQVRLRRTRRNKDALEKALPFHLLIGGVIVPVVMASLVINFPLLLLELFLGMPTQQAIVYWSPISPHWVVDVAYVATYCLIVIGACFLTMYANLDPKGLTKTLSEEGYSIPGVATGAATARYISRVTMRVTLVGGLWMATVVVLVPTIIEALLGSGRPRLPIGGGPFVITAAILLHALKKVLPQMAKSGRATRMA